MKFFVEQIAICPPDPAAAKELINAITGASWVEDHVKAVGFVAPVQHQVGNEADLSFNYAMGAGGDLEFEVLHYTIGANWMQRHGPSVSHLGMHCDAVELAQWRTFFAARGIPVAQEVNTFSHTNPAIAGKREYTYVIFGTRSILGVDLKFIVRRDIA